MSLPPSSATTARATPWAWRNFTATSPDATGKPASMPPPSSTTTTPLPTRSTSSRRDRQAPLACQSRDHQENHGDGAPGDICNNRHASLVDHHHRKRDDGGNQDHSRDNPMPTAAGRSTCSKIGHLIPPSAANGGPARHHRHRAQRRIRLLRCDGRAGHQPQAAGGHQR